MLHLICDNYATHKHSRVKAWMKRRSRFHVHFTPTSGSWLSMLERFFHSITVDRLRRGVFRNAAELTQTIEGYIAAYNENPKPFVWTARANDILQKVMRGRAVLKVVQTD